MIESVFNGVYLLIQNFHFIFFFFASPHSGYCQPFSHSHSSQLNASAQTTDTEKPIEPFALLKNHQRRFHFFLIKSRSLYSGVINHHKVSLRDFIARRKDDVGFQHLFVRQRHCNGLTSALTYNSTVNVLKPTAGNEFERENHVKESERQAAKKKKNEKFTCLIKPITSPVNLIRPVLFFYLTFQLVLHISVLGSTGSHFKSV